MGDRAVAQAVAGSRGSALLLLPAAVLALLVLGAIAVDSAVVFTAQRQVADAAAAAANDAAARAVDADDFYRCGAVRLDAGAARRSVAATIAARTSDLAESTATVEVGRGPEGVPTVTVETSAVAPRIFAPAVGGGAATRVRAVATAHAVRTGGPAPATCG